MAWAGQEKPAHPVIQSRLAKSWERQMIGQRNLERNMGKIIFERFFLMYLSFGPATQALYSSKNAKYIECLTWEKKKGLGKLNLSFLAQFISGDSPCTRGCGALLPPWTCSAMNIPPCTFRPQQHMLTWLSQSSWHIPEVCLLYTSDAADDWLVV